MTLSDRLRQISERHEPELRGPRLFHRTRLGSGRRAVFEVKEMGDRFRTVCVQADDKEHVGSIFDLTSRELAMIGLDVDDALTLEIGDRIALYGTRRNRLPSATFRRIIRKSTIIPDPPPFDGHYDNSSTFGAF